MSILVIWSSPNEDGLTAAAKDSVIKGIKQAGTEALELKLNECNVKCCLACNDGWGSCRSEGRCVIDDDFEMVYNKMRSADRIVLVTPVYWHNMSERLKSFLDRLRRCEASCNHHLKGKECMLVACAGGSGRGAIECLWHMEDTLGHMGMKTLERLPVIRFNREYMIPALLAAGEKFAKIS